MSTTMKTPGVYIQELDAFGNSVVPVATAVPAFIGYTDKTTYDGKSLLKKAIRITSLAEFLTIFGDKPPKVTYSVTSSPNEEALNAIINSYRAAQKEVEVSAKALADANAAGSGATSDDKAKAAKRNDDAKANLVKERAKADAITTPDVKGWLKLEDDLEKIKPSDEDIKAAKAELKKANDAVEEGETPTKPQQKAIDKAQKDLDALLENPAVTKAEGELETKKTEVQNSLSDMGFDFVIGNNGFSLATTTINYRLYSAMKFFYANGGSTCYVMTVGAYDYTKKKPDTTDPFTEAMTLLKKEMEPTMLVIPDAVEFDDAYSLQNAMIMHCGEMQNRVAILDIPGGYSEPLTGTKSYEAFRNAVEPTDPKFNSYAAAYYPWLHTTVYQNSDVSWENVDSGSYPAVQSLLTDEFTDPKKGLAPEMSAIIATFVKPTDANSLKAISKSDSILKNVSKSYKFLMGKIRASLNLMAPSAGMAGIYTAVDSNEGVWHAPANVGIQSTIAPAIKIDNEAQQELNMPLSGKSICAIRSFTGRGNLVWGARTLDGNSNDWRYINVRRTLIYIEQSIKDAAKAYVFAPNDAGTWINVNSMISNFLTGLWKQGGLVGPKPADAYSVTVGLGSTMTNDDIQNGIMRISVKVAVSHPAEFIEITFQQEQQKA